MARKVYFVRHAQQESRPEKGVWDPEAALKEGARDRVLVASRYFTAMGVRFSQFWHSGLLRSKQTCDLFMEKQRPNDGAILQLNERLGPGEIPAWEEVFATWLADPSNPRNLSPAQIDEMWPELSARESHRVAGAIAEIARGLADGENAVAVGHNPLINWAMARLTGLPPGDALTYCQAISFAFEGEKFDGCACHLF